MNDDGIITACSHTYQTVEEYCRCLSNINTTVIQLSKGEFRGKSTSLHLDGAIVTIISSDVIHMVSGRFTDFATFLFPLDKKPFFADGQWINRENNFAMAPGYNEFITILPNNFRYVFVTIKHSSLEKHLGEKKSMELINSIRKYNVNFNSDGLLMKFIVNLVQYLLWQSSENMRPNSSTASYEKLLILFVYEYICNPSTVASKSSSNYGKIISRTIIFINSSNKDFNLDQLSSYIYSNKRSIQYSFCKVLNMSPHQFIKATKLNKIRNDLKLSDPKKNNINKVLKQYSLRNISRFRKDYFSFYNETINDTFNSYPTN